MTTHAPLLLSLLPLSLFTGARDDPADWPQYGGPLMDRSARGTIAARSWPPSGPPEVWRTPTPGGFSSFVVGGGRVFTLVTRDRSETCIALDADTGKELWAKNLGESEYDGGGNAGADGNKGGDGPRCTPSVMDGRVYVYDAHMVLSALDAGTGELLWRQDVATEHGGREIRWQNATSPLVGDRLVFVAGGGRGRSLLAFDKNSGKLSWSSGDERMTHATPVLARIHGREQVVFLVQSGLVAVDPGTGEELWRAPYSYRTSSAASPVVHENLVYVSAGYGVGAGVFEVEKKGSRLEARNVWHKRNDLMNHWSTPVCKDGYLYGMFGFKKYGKGPLKCVDMRTGKVVWSQAGFGPGNCIRVGDDLLALSDKGELVLVSADPAGYRELARADVLKGKVWSSPSYADGQVYARSTVEGVRLDLGTGSAR